MSIFTVIMNSRPKCCDFGEYKCSISMPIDGRIRAIDLCIADIVMALNFANIKTVASCCGHGKQHGIISLEDGRELVVKLPPSESVKNA